MILNSLYAVCHQGVLLVGHPFRLCPFLFGFVYFLMVFSMLQITTFGHMDFGNASSQAVTFQCAPNPRREALSLFRPAWYSNSDLSPPAQAGDIKEPCSPTPMRVGGALIEVLVSQENELGSYCLFDPWLLWVFLGQTVGLRTTV